jgi:hypothetical protein
MEQCAAALQIFGTTGCERDDLAAPVAALEQIVGEDEPCGFALRCIGP